VRSLRPIARGRAGRVTTLTLLAALALFVVVYGVVRYAPPYWQASQLRSLLAEAGTTAARADVAAGQALVTARVDGRAWLSPEGLYWHALPDGRVLVGARWEVAVPHLGLLEHTLRFEWYCLADRGGCERVEPEFD
jgi:hypothetical protein